MKVFGRTLSIQVPFKKGEKKYRKHNRVAEKGSRFSERYLNNERFINFDLANPREYFTPTHPVFGQIYCEFIINLL